MRQSSYTEDPDNPGEYIPNPNYMGCLYCIRGGVRCFPNRGDSCADRAIKKAEEDKAARKVEIMGYVREVLVEEGLIG